jgi:hypothetical protein
VSCGSRPSAFISRTARREAIDRDGLWRLVTTPDSLAEKSFGRGHDALRPAHEVHCLASPIHRPIQVDPFAANLYLGLVDAPRAIGRCSKAVPSFDELGRITRHPVRDRHVSQRSSRLAIISTRSRRLSS